MITSFISAILITIIVLLIINYLERGQKMKIFEWIKFKASEVLGILDRFQSVDDKLKVALRKMLKTQENIINRIEKLKKQEKKIERKINDIDNSNYKNKEEMREKLEKALEKVTASVEELKNKFERINEKISNFECKREELKANHDVLQTQKEVQNMLVGDKFDNESSAGDLVEEIEKEINNLEDDIKITDELLEDGILEEKI